MLPTKKCCVTSDQLNNRPLATELWLKDQAHPDLHVTRQIVLGRDRAESRVVRRQIWGGEVRRVERIQEFTAQLESDFLGERNVLNHRQIPQIQIVASESCPPRRQHAVVTGERDARVSPLFDRINYAVRLHSGIGEVEAADVEDSASNFA